MTEVVMDFAAKTIAGVKAARALIEEERAELGRLPPEWKWESMDQEQREEFITRKARIAGMEKVLSVIVKSVKGC